MEPSHIDRFHANMQGLADLLHELISICHESGCDIVNPVIIKIAGEILSKYDRVSVMENFINHSNTFWDKIKERDEMYISEHAGEIFKDLPTDKVGAFKTLFTAEKGGKRIIQQEDRKAIWEFFDSLVKISIKYIHENRSPKYKKTDEGYKKVYTKKYFDNVKLQKYSQLFNVELKWPTMPSN